MKCRKRGKETSVLSEQAKELETAGREGDTVRIKKETFDVLDRYEWFYEGFDQIFGKK